MESVKDDHSARIKIVLGGDSNLDFVVNFEDFTRLSGNYQQSKPNWDQDNFNVTSLTDFEDFVILSNHYG